MVRTPLLPASDFVWFLFLLLQTREGSDQLLKATALREPHLWELVFSNQMTPSLRDQSGTDGENFSLRSRGGGSPDSELLTNLTSTQSCWKIPFGATYTNSTSLGGIRVQRGSHYCRGTYGDLASCFLQRREASISTGLEDNSIRTPSSGKGSS